MANTIVSDGDVIELTGIDSDWSWFDTLTAYAISKVGVPIQSIQFVPGAAADQCVIKNLDASGPTIFDKTCADANDDKEMLYDGEVLKPFLDVSEGTFNAAAKVIIILKKRN